MPSLTEVNTAIHQGLGRELKHFVGSMTALDLEEARAAFTTFCDHLHRHATAEETTVFPRFSLLDLPRKATVELLERDHELIDKRIADAESLLTTLEGTPEDEQRLALVEGLGALVTLMRVLHHHTDREETLTYPAADAALEEAEKEPLAEALRAAESPGQ